MINISNDHIDGETQIKSLSFIGDYLVNLVSPLSWPITKHVFIESSSYFSTSQEASHEFHLFPLGTCNFSLGTFWEPHFYTYNSCWNR